MSTCESARAFVCHGSRARVNLLATGERRVPAIVRNLFFFAGHEHSFAERILALRELEVPPSFRPLRVKTCSCSELVENSLPRPHLAGRYLAANFDVTHADVPRKLSECRTSETPFPSHGPCSHVGRMLSTHVLSVVIAGSTSTVTTCSRTTTSRSQR